MKTRIDKATLITIIQENRTKHQEIFDEAIADYREQAIKRLDEALDRIKSGSLERVYVAMPVPENHTTDYDRAIRMLELNQDDAVVLDESDTAKYVMDDWGWRREFFGTSKFYSDTAAAIAEDEGF